MKKRWLISYVCPKHDNDFGECIHHGSLGEWRVEHLQFKDGPYILVSAHEISEAEYKRLDGWIG